MISWVARGQYHKLRGVLLLMALFTVISACGDEEPTPTATATSRPAAISTSTPTPIPEPVGRLEVRVTDLPNPAITAINLTVDNIEVHRSSDGEWTTVVEGPVKFDLIAVAGVEEILGSETLPPGDYTQVRLHIAEASVTVDGQTIPINDPIDVLIVVKGFSIEAGVTTIATLDFDTEK